MEGPFAGLAGDEEPPSGPTVPLTDYVVGPCWGAQLCGSAALCTPDFVPGKNHLKSKWCAHCTAHGVPVAAARVRAIDASLHATLANARGIGLYTKLPTAEGVLLTAPPARYRLINQTKECKGARLVVFEEAAPPTELEDLWAPMPPDIVRDGWVHLRLSQGTIIPVLHGSASSGAGPSSAATPPPPMPSPAALGLLLHGGASSVAGTSSAAPPPQPPLPPSALRLPTSPATRAPPAPGKCCDDEPAACKAFFPRGAY